MRAIIVLKFMLLNVQQKKSKKKIKNKIRTTTLNISICNKFMHRIYAFFALNLDWFVYIRILKTYAHNLLFLCFLFVSIIYIACILQYVSLSFFFCCLKMETQKRYALFLAHDLSSIVLEFVIYHVRNECQSSHTHTHICTCRRCKCSSNVMRT